jgi:hypothetical protein
MIEVGTCIDLEGVFGVFLHEEEKDEDEAKESTNVGECIIDLLEATTCSDGGTRPPQDKTCKGISISLVRDNLT